MPASRPGCFDLDLDLAAAVAPELFDSAEKSVAVAHWRRQLPGLLMHGDTQPALVIAVAPVIVASYSDDLDAVVLLRLPDDAAGASSLAVGDRLVTVNSYVERRQFVADDIVCGPRAGTSWGNVTPVVVRLVNRQTRLQHRRLQQIADHEWRALDEALARRRALFGDRRVRDARPHRCGEPVSA
ncbi:MAG TPA: hypothetical protein VGF99_00870 [Myxococcota bacterium]